MVAHEYLLICGASARAAAFSALQAGLRPWCADLFGDADLQACSPTHVLSSSNYPEGFVQIARGGPPGPWLYTGGLENRPSLVRRISQARTLWGNDATVLRRARAPRTLHNACREAGTPCPAGHCRPAELPLGGRWLVKPRIGTGGSGIRFWAGEPFVGGNRRLYLQQFVKGDACAAVYIGDGHKAQLLGLTRQLVGVSWLHARRFSYCGSIGPLPLPLPVRAALERLGNALASGSGLRGLFGVDCILKDGVPWPVEVNPRYTASVEVLEYGLGLAALGLHRQQFATEHPIAKPQAAPAIPRSNRLPFIGKAILFARAPVVFPQDGPWIPTLEQIRAHRFAEGLDHPPSFGDIPRAGQRIDAGRPILTFFVRADSVAGCLESLREIAGDLDRRLEKN
jgi:predicted ATP-grasp superfamily ATP-dependent carboligase